MKKYLIVIGFLFGLTACMGKTPEEQEYEKKVVLCKDIMQLYIKEARVYERDQQRLITSCHMSARQRSLTQWECLLEGLRKGDKYIPAADKCGFKDPV